VPCLESKRLGGGDIVLKKTGIFPVNIKNKG